MRTQSTFSGNLLNGILLRLKKKKKAFSIHYLQEKYLKHVPGNKIHKTKLLGKITLFRGGPEFLHGLKEIFVDRIYNQVLPENAIIVDCGAHIGLSVIYLKKICPTAEIICFEPDKKNYELLTKNIEAHGLEKIKALNEATWIYDGLITFAEHGDMSSKIESTNKEGNQIKCSRLANFINQKIDFLKIDIEGAEYEVLKDISSKLPNVERLFIEYHGSFHQNKELVEMLDILIHNNFRFYIKEAAPVYKEPFMQHRDFGIYDLQLNIFAQKNYL